MGVELSFLPVSFDSRWYDNTEREWGYSHEIINVTNAPGIASALNNLPYVVAPKEFDTYMVCAPGGDPTYLTPTDRYDKPIRFIKVADLLTLKNRRFVETYNRNRAVWAYMEALGPEHVMAIYWR